MGAAAKNCECLSKGEKQEEIEIKKNDSKIENN